MGEHPLALPCFVFLAFLDNCRCCPSQTLIIVTLFIVTYLLLLYMLFIIIVTINKFLVRMRMFEIVKAGQQCVCSRLGSCAPAQLRRWWAGDLVKHLSVLSLVVGRVTLDSSTYVGAVSTL